MNHDRIMKKLSEVFVKSGTLKGVKSDYLSEQAYIHKSCHDNYNLLTMIGYFLESGDIKIEMTEKAKGYIYNILEIEEYKYDFCEISNCPFCGGIAKLYGKNPGEEEYEIKKLLNGDLEAREYFVKCSCCDGFAAHSYDSTKNGAIREWRLKVKHYIMEKELKKR